MLNRLKAAFAEQADIEKMIITIRGIQVMIDRDLTRVYKVTTSQPNQQVKRNIARFPANFRFQLTTEAMNNLKSQVVTSSWGCICYFNDNRLLFLSCDPAGIQTLDLQNRNLTLYSAKLRDLIICVRKVTTINSQIIIHCLLLSSFNPKLIMSIYSANHHF